MFNKMFAGLRSVLVLWLAAAVAADDPCADLSSPECCYEAYMDWKTSKSSFEVSTQTVVDYTYIYSSETFDVSTTTLCDGFLRYLGPRAGPVTTVQVPASEPRTTWVNTPYPTPAPACTIAEEDCAPFMDMYDSSTEAYSSNTSLPYPMQPPCTTYSSCPGEGGGMCKLYGMGGTVYYWPATMEGDLCGDRTTITHPEPTRSTVLSGVTFVSPSVYISANGLRARSHANKYKATPCGRNKSGFLLTLHPTDVSTYVGKVKRTSTFSQLNLADLNNPTPVTAYFGLSEAPDCQATPESCTDWIEHTRQPILSAPVQMFQDLDPDYKFCKLHPSSYSRMGAITWIPLEPTQDGWPEPTPTSGAENDENDEKDEDDEDYEYDEDYEDYEDDRDDDDAPEVIQVVTTTQTLQDSAKFRPGAPSPFQLSYSDEHGYGTHADYLFGWQGGSLQRAMNSDCMFNAYENDNLLKSQGVQQMNACGIDTLINEEAVSCKSFVPSYALAV